MSLVKMLSPKVIVYGLLDIRMKFLSIEFDFYQNCNKMIPFPPAKLIQ